MPEDKSLFFYGPIYHRLIDPPLAESRRVVADLIPEGSSVLDIGCGTGTLTALLRTQKKCRVVGIDLSLRMLEFAREMNPYPDVTFLHKDATDLSEFADESFDYSVILLLVHELTRVNQLAVLKEALRVSRRVIIVDAVSPLPKNFGGVEIQVVEATIGHNHYGNFTAYLAAGGIDSILKASDSPIRVEHCSVFLHYCREVVMITKEGQPA